MTFLQMQSLLSRLVGDSGVDSDSAFPTADRQFEINQGCQQFAKDSKSLLGYVTSTVASQVISLPSGFLGIHALILDDILLTNMNEVAIEEWEKYVNSGEDKYYFWVNASNTRQLNFFSSNSNSKTYKLHYYRKPTTDLSADSDETPIETQYRRAPVYWAAAELLFQIGKTQMSQLYREKYETLAIQARIETEGLVKKLYLPNPDVGPSFEYDTDRIGHGQIPGGY